MIIGTGIDIIETARIEKSKNNKRFLDRLFTEYEREYFKQKNYNKNTISGIFAAKEAVSKALGYGIRYYKWTDIEINHNKYGKPLIILRNNAENISKTLGVSNVNITISHIDEYAIAFATIEGKTNNNSLKEIHNNNLKEIHNNNLKESNDKVISREIVKDILPKRKYDSHKGTYGKVLVIAGSIGMTGANYLTSVSALRSGCGIVYSIIPKSLNNILEVKTTEVITVPLEDEGKGQFLSSNIKEVLEFAQKVDAIALGPGLGFDEERVNFIEGILEKVNKPIVLDADGINCISKNTNILKNRKDITIITPHPGELANLLDVTIDEIQKNRIKYAKLTSEKFNVITILKGHRTIVCDTEGEVYINITGNPGMATAGSGDVLTGMITSFISQNIKPLEASLLSVYLHGYSGDLSALDKGEYGMIASDILNNIPYALKDM